MYTLQLRAVVVMRLRRARNVDFTAKRHVRNLQVMDARCCRPRENPLFVQQMQCAYEMHLSFEWIQLRQILRMRVQARVEAREGACRTPPGEQALFARIPRQNATLFGARLSIDCCQSFATFHISTLWGVECRYKLDGVMWITSRLSTSKPTGYSPLSQPPSA